MDLTRLSVFFLLTAMTMNCSLECRGSTLTAGVMGGGPLYSGGSNVINALRSSGFNTVIFWTIHVNYPSGNLIFNDQLVCSNGVYVGNPGWPAQVAALKQVPTSVSRTEIAVGSGGVNDFQSIQNHINTTGTGTNSILYRNFQALLQATGVDAVCFNDETLYSVSTMVTFGQMIAALGRKVTLCPYNNATVWQSVKSQLGSTVDAVYLQCYSGGSGNNPAAWNNYFGGMKVQPGLWCKHGTGCTSGDTASTVATKMTNWKSSAGITGGWMWLLDDMLKCTNSSMAQYASAISSFSVSPPSNVLSSPPASALWNGAGANNSWSTSNNWVSNAAPGTGTVVAFSGAVRLTPVNDLPVDTPIPAISFDSSAGSFTLSGNRVSMTTIIESGSAATQTIAMPILLDEGGTLAIRSLLGSGDLTISGDIAGDGNIDKQVFAGGITIVALTGSNTYSGTTSVSAGNLAINSIKPIGSPLPSSLGQPSPGNETIALGVSLSAALIYRGSGDETDRPIDLMGNPVRITQNGTGSLKLSGNMIVTVSGAKRLNLDGSGVGEIAGSISNPPVSGNTRVAKEGTGTWILSGTNHYGQVTEIIQGSLVAGSDSPASGPGAFGNTSNAIFVFGTNNASLLIGGPFAVNRNVVVQSGGSAVSSIGGNSGDTSTFGGNVDLQRSVVLTSEGGGNVQFLGAISNTGGVTKAGVGQVTFGGTNTYSGSTIVEQGVLAMIGGGSASNSPLIDVRGGAILDVSGLNTTFKLHSGQVLSGAGTVRGNSIISGTVNPSSELQPATLSFDGSVTLMSNAVYHVDLSVNSNDMLVASGDVILGGATLTVVGTPTNDTITILATTGSLTGVFKGLPDGGGIPSTGYTIDYVTGGTTNFVVMNKITSPIKYVIHISIDGMMADAPRYLMGFGLAPNFARLFQEGSYTEHAHTDFDSTVTTPNHTGMLTGRPVNDWPGKAGHLWGNNDTWPWERWGLTIHQPHILGQFYGPGPSTMFTNASVYCDGMVPPSKTNYSYVSSTMDVAHDAGLRVGMVFSKSRITGNHMSVNEQHGRLYPNQREGDPGVSKIHTGIYTTSPDVVNTWVSLMATNPYNYSFVLIARPDEHGHAYSWSYTQSYNSAQGIWQPSWNTNISRFRNISYMGAIQFVDQYLEGLFSLIDTNEELHGKTAIVLTSDHGGKLETFDHNDITDPDCYRVVMMAWGPGIPAGGDLYAMNPHFTKPGITNRPDFNAPKQPIRNIDSGNLALSLLGLGAIPGSSMNFNQTLGVVDSDNDGLSDNFERTISIDPYVADTDGDGMNDGDEWITGTDPKVPQSLLILTDLMVEQIGEQHILTWSSESNKIYSLWSSTNMALGFTLLTNNIAATPPFNVYTNTTSDTDMIVYGVGVEK